MTTAKICVYCGHRNLPRAIYCFECHTCLNPHQPDESLAPLHQSISSTTQLFEPEPIEVIRERRKTRDYLAHLENGLTCLRCSTINNASAAQCKQCNALLNIPDEVYGLRAIGNVQSSIGQTRTINEDEVGLWGRGHVLIALVADGMGGAAAGEEASRFVREAVQATFTGVPNGSEVLDLLSEAEIAERLRSAIQLANYAIMQRIKADESVRGMGTTATLAFVRGSRVVIAHVGDSRAYIVNKHSIVRVTDDHSFVEVLIASGHITRRQAAIHPMRSVLYRALGHTMSERIDIYHLDLNAGDRLIVCSDGLIRHMLNNEIAHIAMRSEDPAGISRDLIDLANARGGEDNISVATIIVQEDHSLTPIEELLPTPCDMLQSNNHVEEMRTTRELPHTPLQDD